MEEINLLSHEVIGLAMKVHNKLGPGLLESAYRDSLFYEIDNAGMEVFKEYPISIKYENIVIDKSYRIDLLVENKLVLELKSVKEIGKIHLAQTLTYLRLGNFKLGLIINFNVLRLRQGIKRVILY